MVTLLNWYDHRHNMMSMTLRLFHLIYNSRNYYKLFEKNPNPYMTTCVNRKQGDLPIFHIWNREATYLAIHDVGAYNKYQIWSVWDIFTPEVWKSYTLFPKYDSWQHFLLSFSRSLIKFIVKFLSNKYFYIKIPPFTQIKWGCSKKGGNREKGRNREIPL